MSILPQCGFFRETFSVIFRLLKQSGLLRLMGKSLIQRKKFFFERESLFCFGANLKEMVMQDEQIFS